MAALLRIQLIQRLTSDAQTRRARLNGLSEQRFAMQDVTPSLGDIFVVVKIGHGAQEYSVVLRVTVELGGRRLGRGKSTEVATK